MSPQCVEPLIMISAKYFPPSCWLGEFSTAYRAIQTPTSCPIGINIYPIALVASNSLIVPLQTEFFALEGLTQLMKTIERIKDRLNSDLDIRGILLTMFDRRNKLSSQVETEARNYFKEKVYNTIIPRNVRLSEAPSHGMPVLIYDKNCPGSKSYFNFAEEFINQDKFLESAA